VRDALERDDEDGVARAAFTAQFSCRDGLAPWMQPCESGRNGAKNAHPDWIIGVSALEHDPYPCSNFRDSPRSDGDAGKGPRHTGPEHVRHSNLHATSVERIGRVDDHGPVNSMERSHRPVLPTR
jgi:hypothetical protein